MIYKGIIFDLDGTLLDSLRGIADASNRLLQKYGYPTFRVKRYKDFVGKGIRELIIQILPKENRDGHNVDKLVDEYKGFYHLCWEQGSWPYKGIKSVLTRLQEIDVKMAILSNKTDSYVKLIVNELLGQYIFDAVIGNLSEEFNKPDPTNALKIAQKMNLKPQQIIFVGDTGIDMQTAKNAGMIGVGVLWGFRGKEELLESGAQKIIKSPGQLLDLI